MISDNLTSLECDVRKRINLHVQCEQFWLHLPCQHSNGSQSQAKSAESSLTWFFCPISDLEVLGYVHFLMRKGGGLVGLRGGGHEKKKLA